VNPQAARLRKKKEKRKKGKKLQIEREEGGARGSTCT
jgi:hypothetical protein